MKLSIPHSDEIELLTLILDLNGTLAVKGVVVNGVLERLEALKKKGLEIYLFSGDTRGNAKKIAEELGINLVIAGTGEEKRIAALNLHPDTCVTIGNGLIDVPLFQTVKLSIATLQAEGVHMECAREADILVPSIIDALDLLIDENSLIATLRR